MKTCSLPTIALTLLLLTASAVAADLESERARYRSYHHDSAQVMQAFDYDTIQFIERMYTAIREIGTDTVNCVAGKAEVTFRSTEEPSRKATLKTTEQGNIEFNGQMVAHKDTIQLCGTLLRIFSDLSMVRPCTGIAIDQFPTRAYKRRTILEFRFGDRVVVIDGFSNGPSDDERLYVLDLIEPSESFFFAKPRSAADR
jgi:hypothetical protein